MNAISMIRRCAHAQAGRRCITGTASIARAIVEALRRIVEAGGTRNFVIFDADPPKNYFVQFAASCGIPRIRAEAVSNQYLAPSCRLSQRQAEALRSLGWHPPTPVVEVYGFRPDEELMLKLHLAEPDLRSPMTNGHPPAKTRRGSRTTA